MIRRGPQKFSGFTLVELIVVIAILGVLIGLLLPAIQAIRASAARTECTGNLKQIVLATHASQDTYKWLPPGLGWYPPGNKAYGIVFFHLLPFVEEKNLYNQAFSNGVYNAINNGVYARRVGTYVCPADPSVGPDGTVRDGIGTTWGASSYGGNVQVFCVVWPDGRLRDPQGKSRLDQITDGTSSTILYAEKYARCTGPIWPEGGSFWAYDVTGPLVQPLHPGFAISWTSYSIGPDSKFRAPPSHTDCDPSLAATGHRGGVMQVGMADGGVRSLAPSISGDIWWALCTPRKGDNPGNDW